MIAIKDDVLKDLVVVKRSGQRVAFNPLKIAIAIKNAFDSVADDYSNKDTNIVYIGTLKYIIDNYQDRKTINVEDVQDIIEKMLLEYKYKNVYESFSSYRLRRSESRKNYQEKQQHKFARAIEKINYLKLDNIKTKNVLSEYGNIISHEYAKAYVLDNKYVRASQEGKIYIHNMDYFNYGYMGNTFLDIRNILSNGDFYDAIDMIINAGREIKGEIGIPSLDKSLIRNVKNKYQDTFIKLLNKYLNNMGFNYLVGNKKIEDKILREDSFDIEYSDYQEVFNNDMLFMILNNARCDAREYVYDYYKYNISKMFMILNQNNNLVSISFGNSHEEFGKFIENIIYDIVLENKYLDNVSFIYKVSDNIDNALELITSNKNVKLYFVSTALDEYFSDGSRIYENIYSDSISYGRMNVCNTSINIARLGIKYKKLNDKFYQELDSLIDLVKSELMMVFENIGDKTKDSYDYLFNKNIYDSDKLDYGQKIRKVIKNGTLNINLSGLFECSIAIDKDNYLDIALKIVKYINKKTILLSLDNKLNFTLSHIVNESAMEFMDIDKAIFGNISNNEYYENLGSISKLDDIDSLNKINKLLTGGFMLDISLSSKEYNKEVKKAIDKLKEEYTGIVSIRRKL